MRALIVIPAYNEAANLAAVVADVRAHCPAIDMLVVDDGSTDDTAAVAAGLNVRCLRMGVRIGVGGAVRAGLRYAVRHNYDHVIRLDGDGQHPAALVDPLLHALNDRGADLVVGSRYRARRRPAHVPFVRRLVHYGLGRALSMLTRQLVTDPTSGLWVYGPRAIDVLLERHPSGYPEAELILVSKRAALDIVEVPVTMRERLGGQTSLTLARSLTALGRLILRIGYDAIARAPKPSMRERAIEEAALGRAKVALIAGRPPAGLKPRPPSPAFTPQRG